MSDQAKRGRGLFQRLKGALGEGGRREGAAERRTSRRIELPIPVELKVGAGEPKTRSLHDFSQQGLCIEAATDGAPGEDAEVRFEGYPEVCGPFVLVGKVLRITGELPAGLVIEIDRQASSEEALAQYRALVLHYIHHKPLLEELHEGYFEARCKSCDWIGRVGATKPTCPRCGQPAVPVTEGR